MAVPRWLPRKTSRSLSPEEHEVLFKMTSTCVNYAYDFLVGVEEELPDVVKV